MLMLTLISEVGPDDAFSRSGLINQLVEFEGFTPAQAQYGVAATGL
jgi:hypothetical protein